MKLIDKNTNVIVADVMTNHSMSVDEILDLMRITVNEEGQLFDEDNDKLIDAWYDDIVTTDFSPWDEYGELIPGVTVREYATYLKNNGYSGNFTINGTYYNFNSLLIATPDDVDLDAIVIADDIGYYGTRGVKTQNKER